MRPIDLPKPKFKVGDKVKHTLVRGTVGTITAVHYLPWSNVAFVYVATWEPREMPAPKGEGTWDMDTMRHPEPMLEPE